jgi:hypothetical protein
MPSLIDLNPAWIDHGARRGLGIAFDCMVGDHHGKKCPIRNWILFANPLDGGPPFEGNSRMLMMQKGQADSLGLVDGKEIFDISGCGESRWTRTGDTFETLSMSPSVNAFSCGHFTLTAGVFS